MQHIKRASPTENVFLITHAGRTDFVKILDFGVAKVLRATASSPKTQVGAFIGSPICVAPEQALGMEIDGRADLYSLGVLLYHMATGQPPFPGKESLVLLSQHLSEAPTPPRQKNPNVSQPLESVILRCLEKNREQRFASMKELAKALADCCGVEMIPFFTTETVAPEVIQTTPNIVVPTRRLPAEEEKLQLTPLANVPVQKKASGDFLPTTQMNGATIDMESPLKDHPEDEEWTLSSESASGVQSFDTMQQTAGEVEASTIEHMKAQKKIEATRKTGSLSAPSESKPSALTHEPTSQQPAVAHVVLSQSLEQENGFDIRQQATEHHLPSVKSAHPEIVKELSSAMKTGKPEESLLRRLETVEIAQVAALQKAIEELPQAHKLPTSEHSLLSVPALSQINPKKNNAPVFLLGGGAILFIAILYLLLG
jgi:serine/threonine protein kinase